MNVHPHFSGIYRLTGYQKPDGSTVSDSERHQAQRHYFRQDSQKEWQGMTMGWGGSDSGEMVTFIKDGREYVALDDERGREGSALSAAKRGQHHTSSFIRNMYQMPGLHQVAKMWLKGKSALMTGRWERECNRLEEKLVQEAVPAVVVVQTEPKNLLETQVTGCTIKVLEG